MVMSEFHFCFHIRPFCDVTGRELYPKTTKTPLKHNKTRKDHCFDIIIDMGMFFEDGKDSGDARSSKIIHNNPL